MANFTATYWTNETKTVTADSLYGAALAADYDADFLYRNGTDDEIADEVGFYLVHNNFGDVVCTIRPAA